MSRRNRAATILGGLAAMAALLTSGPGAQAAAIQGITISPGGFKQGGGDPPYFYIFFTYLDPSYSVDLTNFVDFHGLVGVTPPNFPNPGDLGSPTIEPNNPPGTIWVPSISAPTNTAFPYASDVTWTFYGNSPISNPNPPNSGQEVFLGAFVVETSLSFDQPPMPAGTIITYSFTVTDSQGNPHSGVGTFPLINLGIPEPSSAILLLAGSGGVLLFRHCLRRRRRLA